MVSAREVNLPLPDEDSITTDYASASIRHEVATDHSPKVVKDVVRRVRLQPLFEGLQVLRNDLRLRDTAHTGDGRRKVRVRDRRGLDSNTGGHCRSGRWVKREHRELRHRARDVHFGRNGEASIRVTEGLVRVLLDIDAEILGWCSRRPG